MRPPAQDEAAAAQKRQEDAASARVAALRSSNMSSYKALLQQTKNKRLQEVLAQTDGCLQQIAAKLEQATQGRAACTVAPAGGWWPLVGVLSPREEGWILTRPKSVYTCSNSTS